MRKVTIISKEQIFKKFIFRVEEARLRHELFNGQMSQEITRLNLDRGDAVAAVVHDRDKDELVMTEQFRYPTVEKGPGWTLEIPAGMVDDDDDDPADAVRREIMEEIGYEVSKLQKICTFYLSPGGSSERIHLYYVAVSSKDQTGKGGGLDSEGEDILSRMVKVSAALRMIDSEEIVDAKTIIGLQWLQLNRSV